MNEKKVVRETRANVIFGDGSKLLRTPVEKNKDKIRLSELLNKAIDQVLEHGSCEEKTNKKLEFHENKNITHESEIVVNTESLNKEIDDISKEETSVNNITSDILENLIENLEEDNTINDKIDIEIIAGINNTRREGNNIVEEMADFDYNIFAQKIPEYSGEEKLLKSFINRCNTYHTSLNEAGKVTFYNELTYKLNGEVNELHMEHENWENFRTALLSNIQKNDSLQVMLATLQSLKQGNMSVRDFSDSVRKCLKEIEYALALSYPVAGERVALCTEYRKHAIRIFKEGLREPLKSRVVSNSGFSSLQEIIEFAIEEEPYAKVGVRYNSNLCQSFNRKEPLRNIGFNRNLENRNFLTDRYETFRRHDKTLEQQKLKCFRCNRLGHLAQDCYARINAQPNLPKKEVTFCRKIKRDFKGMYYHRKEDTKKIQSDCEHDKPHQSPHRFKTYVSVVNTQGYIKCYIDTGSQISFIRKSILRKDIVINKRDNCEIIGMGKSRSFSSGSVKADIIIQGKIIRQKLYVVDDKYFPESFDVLIGEDCLHTYGIGIDFENKNLIVKEGLNVDPVLGNANEEKREGILYINNQNLTGNKHILKPSEKQKNKIKNEIRDKYKTKKTIKAKTPVDKQIYKKKFTTKIEDNQIRTNRYYEWIWNRKNKFKQNKNRDRENFVRGHSTRVTADYDRKNYHDKNNFLGARMNLNEFR